MKKHIVIMALVGAVLLMMGGGSVAEVAAKDNQAVVLADLDTDLKDSTLCDDVPAALKETAGCNETKTIPEVGLTLIDVVLGLSGLLAVGVMVYGGVMYASSTGDPNRSHKAQNIIMYGVIGFVIALLAFAIVNFVSQGIFQ